MRYHTDIDPVLVAALAAKSGQGGGSGGTTNYNQLTNRPQINGNTLEGNLTAEDLGLQPENLVVTLTQNGESITADKSYADINQAYTDGKDIYAVIEGNIVPLYGKAGTTYIFQSVLGVQVTDFELNSENEWSVETINIIANSTRPGGIIADEKTDDDTVEVHVDSKTGKAYVNASQDTTTTPPIINTASGNPITLTDSSDNLFQGIEMQGWTKQDSTTGAQLFDASKIPSASVGGATLVNNGDGSFTISGEGRLVSPFSSMINLSHDETVAILRAGDLYINAGQSGEPYLTVSIQNDSGSIKKTFSSFGSATGKINVTEDDLADEEIYLRYGFYGRAGGIISNHTISPMLYQSGSGTWEPYTGGQPSPSPDYPQEIVSAGKYNEDTKKWEYEITIANAQTDPDKNQTVLLTADRPLTKWDKLEKRNGQWGWVYKSNEVVLDGSEDEVLGKNYPSNPDDYMYYTNIADKTVSFILCDKLLDSNVFPDNLTVGIYGNYLDAPNAIYINFGTAIGDNNVTSFKSYLQANPITVLYALSTPIEIPLTPEESAALDALVSYYPTTVISNQQGLDMTVDYIADTKTYIDNKFEALQQSLANTNAQLLGGN